MLDQIYHHIFLPDKETEVIFGEDELIQSAVKALPFFVVVDQIKWVILIL